MSGGSKLRSHQRDWDELADFNAEWAVLSWPGTKEAGWDREAFLATGRDQVAAILGDGDLGRPLKRERVLDFGCGVGRLAPALSEEYGTYVGVDISRGMIERARRLNRGLSNAEFLLSEEEGLPQFEDESFDAVFSFLVLQHFPNRRMIRAYLREFARILAPGGLIAMQLVTGIALVHHLRTRRIRRRLYRVARALRMSVGTAYSWGLMGTMRTELSKDEVIDGLESAGCVLLRADTAKVMPERIYDTTFYFTKP
jgi:ubiquinone/menaquinone biosynthesis C-methylase UbiE